MYRCINLDDRVKIVAGRYKGEVGTVSYIFSVETKTGPVTTVWIKVNHAHSLVVAPLSSVKHLVSERLYRNRGP